MPGKLLYDSIYERWDMRSTGLVRGPRMLREGSGSYMQNIVKCIELAGGWKAVESGDAPFRSLSLNGLPALYANCEKRLPLETSYKRIELPYDLDGLNTRGVREGRLLPAF